MSGFSSFLYVRTLGGLGMFMHGRKLETAFPSPEAREIFLSLLSPLDECIEWERLENALRGNPSINGRKEQVRTGVVELEEMFLRTTGITPLREDSRGVGLDCRTVRIDVHDFRELSVKGLRLFAAGDHGPAVTCLRQAQGLYAGPFLSGDSGRIIDAAREELEDMHQMDGHCLAKARGGTVRESLPARKTVAGVKAFREPSGAARAADYPRLVAA